MSQLVKRARRVYDQVLADDFIFFHCFETSVQRRFCVVLPRLVIPIVVVKVGSIEKECEAIFFIGMGVFGS